jgi:NADH-quinone oxidoreductase subunit G
MFALKGLMTALGSVNIDCRQDGAAVGGGPRAGYLFNSTIAGIEQADAILLIGTNPRTEAPVLNARIRKRFLRGGLAIALIGPQVDLTYHYTHLGIRPADMEKYADALKSAKKPMIVVGSGALARPDGGAILAAARALAESCGAIKDGWNGFNVLHRVASRVGGLDLGFVPGAGGKGTNAILEAAGKGEIDVVYLLGADELEMNKLGSAFVIYQGHHGDAGAARADVVLPGAAYTEKPGTYVNMEGRVQRAERAVFPVGDARDDWAILRALSERLGKTLAYDTLDALRAEMAKAYPTFAKRDMAEPAAWGDFGVKGELSNEPFLYPILNFYMTDPIGRASVTMAKCVSEIANRDYEIKTGTYG